MIEKELGVSHQEAVKYYIATPATTNFYLEAFKKYREKQEFQFVWSWWAFFFGIAFYIYRRLYLEAFVAFIPTLTLTILRFTEGSLIIWGGWQFSYLIIATLISLTLYTRLYKELKIYLILNILFSLWGVGNVIFTALSLCLDAVFAGFFVYQRYQRVLYTAKQYDVKDDKLLTSLNDLGGVNNWVFLIILLWVLFIVNYLF
ncbi:MAG: hypothetical protein U9N49_10870 [Campylobacterota bacterium]|nr:hypothetical protein [Campylobacterota bacterium]